MLTAGYTVNTMDTSEEILRSAGLRITAQRKALVQELVSSASPVDVEDLWRRPKLSGYDLSTIYRSLDHFVRAGIVRALELGKGREFYEFNRGHDHHHIVCTSCNTIEEIEECHVDAIVERARKDSKKFSTVGAHVFELFGICKRCKK